MELTETKKNAGGAAKVSRSDVATTSQDGLNKRKRTMIPMPRLPKLQPKNPPEDAKVSDIFTKTDINGLPDWYEAPNWSMKIAWSVILVAAVTLLVVELHQTIRDFLDNPILTTYSFVNQPEGMLFPEVYICPSNPIHSRTQSALKVDGDWERQNTEGLLKALSNITGLSGLLEAKATQGDLLASFRRPTVSSPVIVSGRRFTEKPELWIPEKVTQRDLLALFRGNRLVTATKYQGRNFTEEPELWIPDKIEDYFKAVGYPVNKFFRECAFNSIPFNCSKFITAVFDADFGKCFLIRLNNSENVAHQTVAGVGLSVVLDLDFDGGYQDFEGGKSQPLYDGVLLKVAEKVAPGTEKVLLIHPATYSTVVMESRKMNLIDRVPLGKAAQLCTDEKDAVNKLKVLDGHYFSTGTCINDCAQQVVVEQCECFLPIDRRYLNEKYRNQDRDICRPDQMKDCVGPALNKTRHFMATCTGGCHVPCQYWDYRASASAAAFPTKSLKVDPGSETLEQQREETKYPHQCSRPPLAKLNRRTCVEEPQPIQPQIQRHKRQATSPASVFEERPIEPPFLRTPLPLPPIPQPVVNELWYWDRDAEDCLTIEHHYCPGFPFWENPPFRHKYDNNFETRAECLNTCAYGNPCLAHPQFYQQQPIGHPTMRYAWNLEHERCAREYSYEETGLNGNNFKSRLDCEHACNATRKDPCNIDTKFHCLRENYHSFDAKERFCVRLPPLAVSNCSQPTSNLFETFQQCENTCLHTNDVPSACNMSAFEPIPGVELCRPPVLYFFHNARLGICEPIEYAGCPFAKGNLFQTATECDQTCVKPIAKPANWKPNIRYSNDDGGSGGNRRTTNSPIQGTSSLQIDRFKWAKGDLIILDVAFSSLQYIELTQDRSMTFTTFVGNVGGQVGLWVGCSVVTMIKIFMIIAPICCCRKKKKKPTADTTNIQQNSSQTVTKDANSSGK